MTELPRITQEMINLYDEFTHKTNDRAGFMRRLTDIVGTSEAAQAIAAMIGANASAAGIVAENDSRLKTQNRHPRRRADRLSCLAGQCVR